MSTGGTYYIVSPSQQADFEACLGSQDEGNVPPFHGTP